MKKVVSLLLMFLMILSIATVCTGCKKEKNAKNNDDPNIVKLYFADETGTSLIVKKHKKSKIEDPAEAAREMIGWMRNKGQLADDDFLAIPAEVAINNLSVEGKILRIDFAVGYEQLEKEKEVICRAALVNTLTQLPGIDYVEFSIGGTTMMDTDGTPIGSLTSESFMFDELPMKKPNNY